MENLEGFKFNKELQLRWNDMDALGHVNNALFVTYFETGRGHFMMEACKGWDWTKHMFLIGSININYYKEMLLLSKSPKIWIKTSKLGTKSFTLDYAVTSEKNNETIIHALGSTTQVMFDMKTRKTIEMEGWMRTNLSEFDNLK